jgi:hypothetical protein
MSLTLDASNCIGFLVTSHLCNIKDLKTASLNTLVKNKAKVVDSEVWKDMAKEYPGLAMEACERMMRE